MERSSTSQLVLVRLLPCLVAWLLERMCVGELREFEAALPQCGHPGKRRKVQFIKIADDDLTGDADVGDRRLSSQRKWRGRAPRKQPLVGRKSFRRPIPTP